MNWYEELIAIYDQNKEKIGVPDTVTRGGKEKEIVLLPICHKAESVQVTVTVNRQGRFMWAAREKDGPYTVIPATEPSESRSNQKPVPLKPLSEDLRFICPELGPGDFERYLSGLKAWDDAAGNEKTSAIRRYIEKGTLFSDLKKSGVLEDTKPEVFGKWTVRFAVKGTEPEECWLDRELQESWVRYYLTVADRELAHGLCMMTGHADVPLTYHHPCALRYPGDRARLISSNKDDVHDFTFQGRFADKEEAFSVGYAESQKMHNALRWLIARQGTSYGNLTVVTWLPDGSPAPSWDDGTERLETLSEPVRVLALESTNSQGKGRLSVVECGSFTPEEYAGGIRRWYDEASCHGFAPTGWNIARAFYGRPSGGKLVVDSDACRAQGEKQAMAGALYGLGFRTADAARLVERASIPTALFDSKSSTPWHIWSFILHAACAATRQTKGVRTMELDVDCSDRSYLYGRLLAVADRAERRSYVKGHANRVTNAKRLMHSFADMPAKTWPELRKKVQPYLNRLDVAERLFYERLMDEIHTEFTPEDFMSGKPLDGMYLLGYSAQMQALKRRNGDDNADDGTDDDTGNNVTDGNSGEEINNTQEEKKNEKN